MFINPEAEFHKVERSSDGSHHYVLNLPIPGQPGKRRYPMAPPVQSTSWSLDEYNERFIFVRAKMRKAVTLYRIFVARTILYQKWCGGRLQKPSLPSNYLSTY